MTGLQKNVIAGEWASGGRGDSAYAPREQGQYAKEFYTTVKTSCICAGEAQ